MMPEDGLTQLEKSDAIFLGAVGWPQQVPDSVSLHGLLLPIRKKFDQFVNVRPHRLLKGAAGPLKKTGFDILCIRENTEGRILWSRWSRTHWHAQRSGGRNLRIHSSRGG